MPKNQALMNAIGNAGIIKLTGNANPPQWSVDVGALRTMLAPEQATVRSPHHRRDIGNMPVQIAGGGVNNVPAVVVIGGGGDRTGATAFQNGTSVNSESARGKVRTDTYCVRRKRRRFQNRLGRSLAWRGRNR